MPKSSSRRRTLARTKSEARALRAMRQREGNIGRAVTQALLSVSQGGISEETISRWLGCPVTMWNAAMCYGVDSEGRTICHLWAKIPFEMLSDIANVPIGHPHEMGKYWSRWALTPCGP